MPEIPILLVIIHSILKILTILIIGLFAILQTQKFKFIKPISSSYLWSGGLVFTRALYSFITNKLCAVYFGPSGITLLAHFQNIVAIFNNIPNDGINKGVIKYFADSKLSEQKNIDFFFTSIILTFVHFIIVGIYFGIENSSLRIFSEFLSSEYIGYFIIVTSISLLLGQIGLLFHSIINAGLDIKKYALIGISSNLVGIAIIWYSFSFNNLLYFLLATVVVQTLNLFFSLVLSFHSFEKYFKNIRFSLESDSTKKIGEFILMAISALIFGKFVDLYVREYCISLFSLSETGYWQSVVKLSDSYTMVFTATVGAVYFPKISSLVHNPFELKKYVKPVFYQTSILVLIGLSAVFVFKDYLIILLFSSEFKNASYLVKYQVAGDVLKLSSWILAFIMSAQAKTSIFIISQALSAIIFIFLLYILIPIYGIEGLTIAHFIRFIGYFTFTLIMYRKLIS